MKIGRSAAGWAERAIGNDGDAAADLDRLFGSAGLAIADELEAASARDAGTEAVAAAGGRGRGEAMAAATFAALAEARDELPRFHGDFGELTAALTSACERATGDLRAVLERYVALRDEVARGIGTISSG